MNPRRVPSAIVTGGAGFIGSRIADALLTEGFRVYVVDDLSNGQISRIPARAELAELSITQAAELAGLFRQVQPELLSHHAAQSSVVNSLDDPQADLPANYQGLLNVLEACRQADTRHFVFASSGAVYGNTSEAAEEKSTPTPVSPYGISKLAGEQYVRYFTDRGHIRATILRYGNVYGPGQRSDCRSGVVSIFADRLLREQPIILFGDGSSVRDYVFIDDVVRAHQFVTQTRPEPCSVFNVGTGTGTGLLELLQLVADCINGTPASQSRIEFRDHRIGEAGCSVLCSQRIRETLGWTPEVSLCEGIRRVVTWLQERSRVNSCPEPSRDLTTMP